MFLLLGSIFVIIICSIIFRAPFHYILTFTINAPLKIRKQDIIDVHLLQQVVMACSLLPHSILFKSLFLFGFLFLILQDRFSHQVVAIPIISKIILYPVLILHYTRPLPYPHCLLILLPRDQLCNPPSGKHWIKLWLLWGF